MDELRPNEGEIEFLNLAYNRFYDVYEEVFQDFFGKKIHIIDLASYEKYLQYMQNF